MRLLFLKIIFFFSLVSCSNIDFLLDGKGSDFLKNKTLIYTGGWDNPVLKDQLFLKIGEVEENKFILNAQVDEKQT